MTSRDSIDPSWDPLAASQQADQNPDQPVDIPTPQWVISDTHLQHDQILKYCPWRRTWASSLPHHDATIIAAWQATVGPDDWVLHLGDVALGDHQRLPALRAQLPGRIILIKGNHDRSRATMAAAGFDCVLPAARIVIGERTWICRHNPAAFSTREATQATRLLHGHSHGNGYRSDVHPTIVAKAKDCSLDALLVHGPVPWDAVA
jgi:calcineurin-like phosphoesterase family protein